MARLLLEVIVQTLADAREAASGGADRLEVVRAIRDGGLTPLFDERGHFNPDIARFMQTARSDRQSSHARFRSGAQARRPGLPEMPPSILLAALGSYDLLPAIVFLPTRRRCDEAAAEAAFAPRRGSGNRERREARREILERLVEQYPEMRRHRYQFILDSLEIPERL